MGARRPMSTTNPSDVNLIVHAAHWDPFSVLGPHALTLDGKPARVVRAFLPEARRAWVVDLTGGEPGVAAADGADAPRRLLRAPSSRTATRRSRTAWRSRTTRGIAGSSSTPTSSARSSPISTCTCSAKGRTTATTRSSGAHLRTHEGVRGVHFAVWAPNAHARQRGRQLQPLGRPPPPDAELRTDRHLGDLHPRPVARARSTSSRSRAGYNGYLVEKADPYGFAAELRPKTASIVWDVTSFDWHDDEWMADRAAAPGARRADLDLRGPPRLLEAARSRTATAS